MQVCGSVFTTEPFSVPNEKYNVYSLREESTDDSVSLEKLTLT